MNLGVISTSFVVFVLCRVHVLCLGFADYDSGWMLMRAQDDNLSFIEVEHGLGELPALVDVRVKSLSEPNRDFIFKGVGNPPRDDDDNQNEYSAIVYQYNEFSVRLYAPNQINDAAKGYAIHTGESPYWKGVNQQSSLEALVKVLCWSTESVPQTCYEVSDLTFVTGSTKGKRQATLCQRNVSTSPWPPPCLRANFVPAHSISSKHINMTYRQHTRVVPVNLRLLL